MPLYLFDHLEKLRAFKHDKNLAIISDVDGTISEIAPTPEEAIVTDLMRDLLSQLNEKFELVGVISGRPLSNVSEMVGVDGILYVGNHGLEYLKNGEKITDPDAEKYRSKMQELCKELETKDLLQLEGLKLEDKGICLCLHYRQCPQGEEAKEEIWDTLNQLLDSDELKISSGRKIIEIKPPLNKDKGTILEKIVKEYNLKKVIYLGDDITDFDAFSKLQELKKKREIEIGTILILSAEIPDYVKNSTQYYVNSVQEVQIFFKWLLDQ